MRRRRGIEQASDGLRDVGVVADRHALGRREAAHHRDRLRDVRIAVAVDERQPKHAHVETFDREEEALGGELAHRVCGGRRAGVVLAGEAATIRTVDQAGAREDEALHGGGTGGAREVLRAEVIDGVRLLGGRATEERRAVDHGIDAAHRGCERIQHRADRPRRARCELRAGRRRAPDRARGRALDRRAGQVVWRVGFRLFRSLR